MTAESGDFGRLAEAYGIGVNVVRDLAKGGVPMDDLEDVLDLRRVYLQPDEGRETFGVSGEVLAKAYNLVDGDLEQLEMLAEEAHDIALSDELTREEKWGKRRFTIALKRVIQDHVSEGGVFVDSEIYEDEYGPDSWPELPEE